MAKTIKRVLSENDKVKIDRYIDSIIVGFSYAINPFEYTERYLNKFANDRCTSSEFNDEFVKLRLDLLEGIDSQYDLNTIDPKIDKELRNYFVPNFIAKMEEQLKVRKKEIKARKKAEEEANAEAKKKR